MSDEPGRGAIFRAIGWLGAGLLLALLGAAAITPANAYDFSVIAPMLLIIVVGTAITLYAGFRGRSVEEEHQLLRRLDAAADDTTEATDHGQDD